MLVSAHMNDLNATGEQSQIDWLHKLLQNHIGKDVKCKLSREFIHTGIRQQVNEALDMVTMDQFDYAASLKPFAGNELTQLQEDEYLNEWLQGVCMTLLGAAAWMLQTCPHIAVYVSSLQRLTR